MNPLPLQDKCQEIIDDVNKVLAHWRVTKHANSYPSHADIQGLFMSKFKRTLWTNYREYSQLLGRGKPVVFVRDWRIVSFHAPNSYLNDVLAQCDLTKNVETREPAIESIHSVNFNSILNLKFD